MPAAALALAALAACGDPAWRDPATSKGSAELTPAVKDAAVAGLIDMKPRSGAKFTVVQPLPALPDWGRGLIGQPINGPFPLRAPCLGNLDAVRGRYLGHPEGVTIVGWAWDPQTKAAPPRVILVDESLLIRGVGVAGAPRPNVPKAIPEVTSPDVGWEAQAPQLVGALDAYGVLADGKTICRLGHIDL
jgi:hypothetical protein